MRRMWIGALAVAAAGIAPANAGAQTGSIFALGVGQPITQQTIPLRMTGRIIVQFHGEAAAGCAIRGLCGYMGTVSWTAPHSGELDIESSRVAGRTQYGFAVFPQPAGPGAPSSGITSAEVTRTPFPGQTVGTACTDVTSTQDPFTLIARHGRVRFNLAQASSALLATRCAGPRDDAIIPRLPAPRLSVARLRRGRLTVGLGGSRSFSDDGFAGTVVSDLMVRLGRPGRTTRVRTSTPGVACQWAWMS